ncbi:ATP-grasp domain-containing protein [Streptomyces amakusaensis]|uniref:ATP-grasp domain-containing protein n=1 Tax=Streptomyces amakusaensis TaxID=67271 RepID=A0ABW0AMR5_9ACTN
MSIAAHPPGYTAGLKEALTGRRDARFVWLCNFEAENEWAHRHRGLPAPRPPARGPLTQRMEELGALLAEPGDTLLLGTGLDPGYRRYAERAGLALPAELVVPAAPGASAADTSRAVLASPDALRRLRALARDGAYLMPMGNTALEERIAAETGLRPAVAGAGVTERVNSKIYSRRVTGALGLRTVPGQVCESVDELREALGRYDTARRPLIVKDAYGVSGRGLFVVDGPARAKRLLRMADQRARRIGDGALHAVVEHFLPKKADLAYQFVIDRRGRVRLDFVKEALIVQGVPGGHRMPAALDDGLHDELAKAAELLGRRLYEDGFFGVVGVDGLLGADGLLYPVLEINARLSMGSYQGRVLERFLRPGTAALARRYPLRLSRPVPFADLLEAIGDPPPDDGGPGAVITCFGTVNAQAGEDGSFRGRLHTVLFAADRAGLTALDDEITAALARVAGIEGTS